MATMNATQKSWFIIKVLSYQKVSVVTLISEHVINHLCPFGGPSLSETDGFIIFYLTICGVQIFLLKWAKSLINNKIAIVALTRRIGELRGFENKF